MKRTRLLKPYKEDGSTTTFPARRKRGVYLIYRARTIGDPQLRYVGHSGVDVYKALYRHFQLWNDRMVALGQRNERVTYTQRDRYRVRVVYTRTKAQAEELEKALILKYQPRDNPDKLELYELTQAGKLMAADAEAAPFVEDVEAPF